MNLNNQSAMKTVLVTGGARRIGAAIITLFHEVGYKVIIHCNQSFLDAQNLALTLNQKRPDSAYVLQKDLAQAEASIEVMEEVIKLTGRLDVLINNASLFSRTTFSVFDEKQWDELFKINLKAPFMLSLHAKPLLAQTEGVIINITDIHAEKPLKEYAVYCQSKAAFLMQTKALALEFAPQVRVNAIAPGAIVWPEQDNALSIARKEKIIAKTPLQCHGQPWFIAQAALALVNNPFITGQVLNVDGGRSIA